MARDSSSMPGSVLSRTKIRKLSEIEALNKLLPAGAHRGRDMAAVPVAPNRMVLFRSFMLCGLVPPVSPFLLEVLEFYNIQLLHLTPNAIFYLAVFAYTCEIS